MKIKTIIGAISLSLLPLIAMASPANAADVCPSCYGGVINNLSGVGTFPIPIYNGVSWMKLQNAHISLEYSNFRDVDAFKVEQGCTATSQWGHVYTSYTYSDRIWWDSSGNNSMDLKLKYKCYV